MWMIPSRILKKEEEKLQEIELPLIKITSRCGLRDYATSFFSLTVVCPFFHPFIVDSISQSEGHDHMMVLFLFPLFFRVLPSSISR